MQEFKNFIQTNVISFSGYDITIGQLLAIPILVLFGYFLLGWLVSRIAKAMTARQLNPDLVQMVRRALFIVGLVILLITTLEFLNIPITAFAFVSGAIAIGVGFGAQNIINNFISGWILIWERPIRINDFIEVGPTTGKVEEINTRSTKIRRVDGVHILVPNSKLLEETVVNWTLVDNLLRCIVRVGIQYGSDVQRVKDILIEVAGAHDMILDEPSPEVIFEDFGDNALIFDLYFWVHSQGDRSGRQIRSDVRFALDKALADAEIVIAFPQRDIHLDGNLTIVKS